MTLGSLGIPGRAPGDFRGSLDQLWVLCCLTSSSPQEERFSVEAHPRFFLCAFRLLQTGVIRIFQG